MSAYLKLKPMQRRFVDLIVRRMNGSDAVRKLRPKLARPDVLAAKWRALPEVKEAIAEREVEAMEDAGITNAQILLSIAAIADLSVKEFVNADGKPKRIDELSDEAARVVQAIEVERDGTVKYRVPSRLDAKRLLGQHRKLFTERHEHDLGRQTLEQLVHASRQPEGTDDAE